MEESNQPHTVAEKGQGRVFTVSLPTRKGRPPEQITYTEEYLRALYGLGGMTPDEWTAITGEPPPDDIVPPPPRKKKKKPTDLLVTEDDYMEAHGPDKGRQMWQLLVAETKRQADQALRQSGSPEAKKGIRNDTRRVPEATNKNAGTGMELLTTGMLRDCWMFSHHKGIGDLGTMLVTPDGKQHELRIEVKAGSSRWLLFTDQMVRYWKIMQARMPSLPLLREDFPLYAYWLWSYSSVEKDEEGGKHYSMPHISTGDAAEKVISSCTAGYVVDLPIMLCLANATKLKEYRKPKDAEQSGKRGRPYAPISITALREFIKTPNPGDIANPDELPPDKRRQVEALSREFQAEGIDPMRITIGTIRFTDSPKQISKGKNVFRRPSFANVVTSKLRRIYIVASNPLVAEALKKRLVTSLSQEGDLSIGCLNEQTSLQKKLRSIGLLREEE